MATSKTLTSRLVMELVDRVTGPAKTVANSILGIERAAGGKGGGFGSRLSAAIDRNNAALQTARGRLFDAAAGLYALKAAFSAPIASAKEMNAALTGVGIKSGASAAQLEALRKVALQASGDVNQGAIDLVGAVDYLVGMGMSLADAQAAVATIGKASTATGAELLDMSQAGYAAMSNLKVPAADLMAAFDAMSEAGKQGGFELKDMAQYFPAIGAAYAALGQKGTGAVADLAAALQVMRMDTGDASSAATNLQNVLQKVYSNETIRNFKKLGIDIRDVMKKAAKDGQTPIEALTKITNEALGGDLSRLGEIFSDAQVQAGVRSMIQHYSDFERIRKDAAGASGVNERDFATKMAGDAEKWKAATIAAQNFGLAVGNAILPPLTALLTKLTPIIGRLAEWTDAHPKLTAVIFDTIAAVVAFKAAAAGLSFIGLIGRGGALEALSLGFNTVGRAAIYLNGAATAAVALQSALKGMAGAGALTSFEAISAGLGGMVTAIPGVSALATAVGAIGTALATISAPLWLAIAAGVAAVGSAGLWVWRNWQGVAAFFSGVGEALGEILAPAIEAIRPALDWLAPIGGIIAAGWEKAKAAIGAVKDWLGGLFTQNEFSEGDKERWKQAGRDFIYAIWDGMKEVFTGLLSWFESKLSTLLDGVAGLANAAAGLFGTTGNAPAGAPNRGEVFKGQRAGGGPITRGSRYLVGEKGPELITASRSSYVHSAGAGQGGGNTFNLGGMVIHAPAGADPAEIARLARRAVEDAFREAMRGVQADTGLATY